jgi:hypothetical protein
LIGEMKKLVRISEPPHLNAHRNRYARHLLVMTLQVNLNCSILKKKRTLEFV